MIPPKFPSNLCRTTAAPGKVLRAQHEGQEFTLAQSDSKRKTLLSQVRGGDGDPVELDVDLVAFSQERGVSNRNFLRFKRGILRSLAKSFEGAPLLRDHQQDDITARGGTVTRSTFVKGDDGGRFVMSARLTAPWAVEALLAGNLDRFSIGWNHPGIDTIFCSACKAPILTECSHLPGDTVEGSDERAEFIFNEAEGVEVSAVSVPAVAGTGITEIRSALSQYALTINPKERNMEKIAKALGLQNADESTILAALKARDAQAEASAKELGKLQEAQQNSLGEIAKLNAELHTATQREREAKADSLFTEFSDRFPKERDAEGKLVASAFELALRELASKDFDAARAILIAAPRPTPAGQPAVFLAPTPAAPVVDDHLASALKQCGVSADDFAKFNPMSGSALKQ